MNLEERLTSDLKQAMLNKESVVVSVLRILKSEMKNASIAAGGTLNDEQATQVIRREINKRQDAATAYRNVKSEERALSEEAEATVLKAYLPAQADSADVEAFVKTLIATFPEVGPKQRGDLIRQTMAHFSSQTDGKTVSEIVSRLTS